MQSSVFIQFSLSMQSSDLFTVLTFFAKLRFYITHFQYKAQFLQLSLSM